MIDGVAETEIIRMAQDLFIFWRAFKSRLRIMESVHCTIPKEKWIETRRTWHTRLYGGRLPLWRASAMLTILVLAASFFPLLALALPVLSLRPYLWRMSRKWVKIYEQVPEPCYYLIRNGILVAHPVVMRRLLLELERLQDDY